MTDTATDDHGPATHSEITSATLALALALAQVPGDDLTPVADDGYRRCVLCDAEGVGLITSVSHRPGCLWVEARRIERLVKRPSR